MEWVNTKTSAGLSALNPFSTAPEKGSDGTLTTSNADDEELADITLMWMIDRCRPFLTFNEHYLDYLVEEHEKKIAVIRKEAMGRFAVSRMLGQPDLKFGYACGPIQDNTGVTSMAGSQNRAPGQYTSDFTVGNIVDPTHDKHHTHEYMHPCVRWRYFENGDEYKSCRGLDGFKLVDYTGSAFESSPARNDRLSTGVVWEKAVPKPAKDSGPTIRVSEIRIEKDIEWEEVVEGKKVTRSAESLEYRLMGEKIWEALQKGQSFDKPVKAKGSSW
ncbi:hypothetical protein AA313_de0209666 [Arthrobotrys entomopaga]|nr:hypothetical protein AA313_de0209666 [Arthrobotrys entomopaga]